MNKNEINNSNIRSINTTIDNGSVDRSNNKLTDNSVTKSKEITNNKIIPKGKNKEKKNRNILPPQEEPTVENGGYMNILDENFKHLRTKPEIENTSFIRPNLEKLYLENKDVEMFAYVSAHRNKDDKYVLYNLCSESMYLADHVLVDDDNDQLFTRIGQCIRFNGKPYPYGDKYSVTVSNINDLNSAQLSLLSYKDKEIHLDDIDKVFCFISEIGPVQRYDLLNYLLNKLEAYSVQLFSNKKFIIGMICNFYFMGSINSQLSSNVYINSLDISKERFIMIFSDILFRIECGLIQGFTDLQNRIIMLSILAQGLPDKNIFKTNNEVFVDFCKLYHITNTKYIKKYMKDLYKWYDIKNIKDKIDTNRVISEMRYATASIILNS